VISYSLLQLENCLLATFRRPLAKVYTAFTLMVVVLLLGLWEGVV
jgi:hypothetical protein